MEANVDGDIFPYKIGYATEQSEYETSDGVIHSTPGKAKKHIKAMGLTDTTVNKYTEAEPVSHALRLTKNLLSRVESRTGADKVTIYLSGDNNFREKLATIKPYKGNRPDDKPLHFNTIRDYLLNKGAIVVDGMEADDALGINQRPDTTLCTIDKDMDMIPGRHYNWDKDIVYTISPTQATYNFYHQLLRGDTTDNIQGCPGIGEKNASLYLNGCTTEEELYETCMDLYEQRVPVDPFAALLENARLLWILREPEGFWLPPHMRETKHDTEKK